MVDKMFKGKYFDICPTYDHKDYLLLQGMDCSHVNNGSMFRTTLTQLHCKEFSRFTQADVAAVEHAFSVAGISLGKVGEERLYGEQKVMVLPAQPDFQTFPWVSIPAGIALIVVGIVLMILNLTA